MKLRTTFPLLLAILISASKKTSISAFRSSKKCSCTLAFRVDVETVEELKNNGMDIVKNSGHDHRQLPVPAAFITNTSGQILFTYVNPDYRERISGNILKEALREYR